MRRPARNGAAAAAARPNPASTDGVITDRVITDRAITDRVVTDRVITDLVITDQVITDLVITVGSSLMGSSLIWSSLTPCTRGSGAIGRIRSGTAPPPRVPAAAPEPATGTGRHGGGRAGRSGRSTLMEPDGTRRKFDAPS